MRFEDKVAKLRIEKHKGKESPEFLEDVKNMCEGEAFEYLLGEVNFCNAKVDLSKRPMIPRTETEFWVKEAISLISGKVDSSKNIKVLDLFSGSGCVGLAILKNITNSYVTFIELNERLKEQIEISIKKNGIDENRTQVLTGDIFGNIKEKFDYIFAVPPYVPPQMREEVMKELKAEEELNFFDKEDGYFYIKKVLSECRNYLNEGGELFMEFDITQREKIGELIKENNFENYSFLGDPYGHECAIRVV